MYKKKIAYIIFLYFICICIILYLQPYKENFQEEKENHFHFHNTYSHYGDCILNLKLFYNNHDILKDRNIKITYYYEPRYIKNLEELTRYVHSDITILATIDQKPDDSIELWMGHDIGSYTYKDFVVYHNEYYKKIIKIMGLDNYNINTSTFQDEDYLLDIYDGLEDKYKELDILILNSSGSSNQFYASKEDMKDMCTSLLSKYKIATCEPVDESIACTMRDGLSIQDIGAISTHSKYIICVMSGPITACFNIHTKKYVNKWIFLEQREGIMLSEINYVISKSTNNIEKYLN